MATLPTSFKACALKVRFKERCVETAGVHQNWQIRVHRSLSWLKRATEFPEDELEARFLFLWIALNSLYSRWDNERNMPAQDGSSRDAFFHAICGMDQAAIAACIHQHRPLVKRILDDAYLSNTFWRNPDDPKAKGRARQDVNHLDQHLKNREHERVLHQVMERLFVLRGQIVHGASTRGSRHNRSALKTAALLLEQFVPVIIRVVIERGCGDDWPELCYPPEP